ncbi:c-type cytochrome [Chitinophaga varians]|uniref:c-type cytochrome n=1 Tax=Chitinophaga varians TaxID=2202339 RepID=UPI00165F9C90|nr:cytochrome c [Chitinophaga varians]MBC9913910.1 cytochrome c [Chitinophaga varians]
MKYLCYVWLCCLMFACRSTTHTDWKTIDYGPFKLKAPQEWKKITFKGIDSYVGGLSNGKDTLSFDYGIYGVDMDLDSSGTYQEDTINGLQAVIAMSGEERNKHVAVDIYLKDQEHHFFMSGFRLDDVPTVLQIFKSIYFPYSDTTINPPIVMTKFQRGPLATGKWLFQMNCAACHQLGKKMMGPAMAEIGRYRDKDWIYQFLTNRDAIQPDSLTIAYQKEAGSITCVRFPGLTKMEVNRILGYAK